MSLWEESARMPAEPAPAGFEEALSASDGKEEGVRPPRVSEKVEQRLREEPYTFQFFQAVRLLAQLYPQRETVGKFVPPMKEVVRFKAHQSTSFPPSDIWSLESPEGRPSEMEVSFMGLTGPNGVLPLWYTILILERMKAQDHSLRAFLDIFNHRFISLFYRAWEKYRFTLSYERGERASFTQFLLDLIGLGTKGLADRQNVEDDSLIFYSGLLCQKPRSAQALSQIVSDYFEVPVEIEQFLGSWYRLEEDNQCYLEWAGADLSEKVGEGAVVGDEMWDPHARVRVKIGPMPLEKYLQFLPNGSAHKPLGAILRFFSNDEFDFEVQLILKRDDVPLCELGAEGDGAPQLGWVTWMRSIPMQRDPQETILQY
jgi:type VI secretion system protein ImpH